MRRIRRSVVLLVTVASLTTACGGSEPAVSESFAEQATAVCQTALEAKEGWSPFPVPDFSPVDPDASALPEVATWLREEVSPTFEAWLDDMEALGDPPSGRDAWSGVLDAVATIVRLNDEQVRAAEGGNVEGFVDAAEGLEKAQTTLEQTTTAVGVPTCAEVHE